MSALALAIPAVMRAFGAFVLFVLFAPGGVVGALRGRVGLRA